MAYTTVITVRLQKSDSMETVHINQYHHSLLASNAQRIQAARVVVDAGYRDTVGTNVRCVWYV